MNQPRCSETLLAPPAVPGAPPGALSGPPAPRERAGCGCSSVCLARGLSWPRRLQGPWGQDGGGEGNIFALSPLLARVNGKAAVGPRSRGDGSTCGTCRGDIKAVTESLPPPAAVSADLTNFLRLGGRMGGVGVTLPGPGEQQGGPPGTKPQLWEMGLREDGTPLIHPQPHCVPQCPGEQQWGWYWGNWGEQDEPQLSVLVGAVGSGWSSDSPSPAHSRAHGTERGEQGAAVGEGIPKR